MIIVIFLFATTEAVPEIGYAKNASEINKKPEAHVCSKIDQHTKKTKKMKNGFLYGRRCSFYFIVHLNLYQQCVYLQ